MRLRSSPVVVAVGLTLACIASAGRAAGGHFGSAASGFTRGDATSPSWSPDGKQIAFAYGGPDGPYRIVRTASRPGGAVHTILGRPAAQSGCCGQLTWVPGGRIVFENNRDILFSVGLQGRKPKPIVLPSCPGGGCEPWRPIVSPNREYVAFATTCGTPHCPDGILLVKLTGRRPSEVSSQAGGDNEEILGFSPDSKQLVFSSSPWSDPGFPPGPPPGPPVLSATRLSSGDTVPLAQSGIPAAALVPSDANAAQWSPNGRWLAFVEAPTGLASGRALEVVPTTGAAAPRTVATCPTRFLSALSWSPTSKLIAFNCTSGFDGSAQLMAVRPDGTHLTDLLNDQRLTYTGYYSPGLGVPQWSPDGSRLLFLARRFGHRTMHVWTIRPNGHDLIRLG